MLHPCRFSAIAIFLAVLVNGGRTEETATPALAEPRQQVPTGFRAAAGTVAEPYTDTGWAKEIVHEATGIEMVYIPAGSFTMGSPANESGREDDETQHRVTLTHGFYLGKVEVTQGQWQALMGRSVTDQRNLAHPEYPLGGEGESFPIYHVNWDEVVSFCAMLTERERRAGRLPEGYVFRLPTEAEWEYACRAESTTVFGFGDNVRRLGDYAWYSSNSGGQAHEVGRKEPNAWGLYDMHGNVWEWCHDWYGDYPNETVTDPVGPASGRSRVYRGGKWFNGPRYCRSAFRNKFAPGIRIRFLGFRVSLAPAIRR